MTQLVMEDPQPKAPKYFPQKPQKRPITIIGHGGCGVSSVSHMLQTLDPDQHPDHNFIVFEADERFTAAHFSEEAIVASQNSNIRKWFDQGLVTIDRLGNGEGAGGIPENGEKFLEAVIGKYKYRFSERDNVIQIGGGGGGTASGTEPVMAEFLKEVGALTYNIITQPALYEGLPRIERSNKSLRRLRGCSPTQIIFNENTLTKKLPLGKVYGEINQRCLYPIIHFLRAYMQEVANVSNHDRADWREDNKDRNRALCGLYVAENGSKTLNFEEMKNSLIENPYLEDLFVSNAALEIFVSADADEGWTPEELGNAMDIFRKRFKKSKVAMPENKISVMEYPIGRSSRKAIGFVLFAPDKTSSERKNPVVRVPAALPSMEVSREGSPSIQTEPSSIEKGNGHEEMMQIFGISEDGSTHIKLDLPASVAKDFNSLFKNPPSIDRNEFAIKTQTKIQQLTGHLIHVPLVGASAAKTQ